MNKARLSSILLRTCAVAAGLAAWFWTQSLIGARGFPAENQIADAVHSFSSPVNQFLAGDRRAASALLVVSSAVIDALALFLLLSSIFGRSFQPFLELLAVFALRQMCQGLTALPPPPGMLWFDPGFPSLLVTYGVSTDLFFSGHTAIAVLGAVELGRFNRRWGIPLGVCAAVFEASTVLVLRAHYFMDVFAGAAVALLIAFWPRKGQRAAGPGPA